MLNCEFIISELILYVNPFTNQFISTVRRPYNMMPQAVTNQHRTYIMYLVAFAVPQQEYHELLHSRFIG